MLTQSLVSSALLQSGFLGQAGLKSKKPMEVAPSAKPVAGDKLNLSSSLKFAGQINEDYGVELRIGEPINFHTVSSVLRSLYLRHELKKAQGDQTSSLKLFLDAGSTNSFTGTSRAALSDIFTMIDRPVDVVIKQWGTHMGALALQSATGKRFMYDNARLNIGPITDSTPHGRNDDLQFRRELGVEYHRDLEHQFMTRTGLSTRKEAWDTLNSSLQYNALQALNFGKYGIVDAVIVGYDQVVTRADLEAYILKNKLAGEKLKSFLANPNNVDKIPTRSLASFSAESIPQVLSEDKNSLRAKLYTSVQDAIEKAKAKTDKEKADAENRKKATAQPVEGEAPLFDTSALKAKEFTVFLSNKDGAMGKVETDKIGLLSRISEKTVRSERRVLDNLTEGRGFLADDVIFFNEGFNDSTAEQITDGLMSLDNKKRQTGSQSNIKILVNSNGGSIASGSDIRSTIRHAKSKVDVIVTGMAASCGAFLVSSATGNRLATPGARIMIHDAWTQYGAQRSEGFNQQLDALDQITRHFVDSIATAADRPFKAVWDDMKADVWLNPLESMFYGKRGLTDAILVGSNKVITKADVAAYLLEQFGDQKAVDRYIKERQASYREGRREWKPEEHNEKDPFSNPLQTIQAVAAKSAKLISEVPELAGSVSNPTDFVEHLVIKGSE